jgi:ABC-2 type transport system ATP-binding protein
MSGVERDGEHPLAVRCRGLVKHYDRGVVAVDGLDLDVRVGECFGLLGPNGAGKTTTVEILEGLLDATAGDVEVLGARFATDERALRERIGVSLQQTHLPERLSVGEILSMFRSFFSRGRDPDDILRVVSLEEKKNAWYEKLSGGQRQRLAVACALVGDPELLFLDEPTTGLDPQSRLQLWDVVENFKRSGRTVVLTTHYMEEAERLCDRVGIIDHGRAIALGTPRDLIASLGGQEVIELTVARQPARLRQTPPVGDDPPRGTGDSPGPTLDEDQVCALPGVRGIRRVADGFALSVEPLHVALPALVLHLRAAGLELERLATRHATLEDVFVALTGRGLRD